VAVPVDPPPADAPTTPRGGKRRDLVVAARRVFGRDGYARASIDAIAAEAAVSTRTLYNHFGSKERLFAEVLTESATEVSDGFAALADEGLAAVDRNDPAAVLGALGHAMRGHRGGNPEHFALVRQINAEAGHFPADVIEAWQEAGPRRVQRRVAEELERLAAAGRLALEDPALQALQLTALVGLRREGAAYAATADAPEAARRAEDAAIVAAGVRTFLHGRATR
jgi:AcrR family transcriptional regulator